MTRSVTSLALLCLLCLAGAMAPSVMPASANSPSPGAELTLILADPADPYYTLAEEIAAAEALTIVPSLDQALAAQPAFLLWVISPSRLSERAMVEFGLALRDWSKAISTGIITGATLEDARALWGRASAFQPGPIYAVNAANPAGNIEAAITLVDGTATEHQALTKEALLQSLQQASYLTYTGHGGSSYLRLDDETTLRAGELPDMPPLVVATGSCNTFQPWETDSIALAFANRGAAAYAGFVFSPNEGYLIGEFDGLAFRYTWPGFPIGHVIQAQNRGTVQGFASFPYYQLLGDPRLALQVEAPYRLVGVDTGAGSQVWRFAGAPSGLVPVRVPGGARYASVEVPGVGITWRGEPFYNAHLQAIDVGEDKFVLVDLAGGAFRLQLRTRPPWLRVVGDVLLDSLDGTLLFLQDHGGAQIMFAAGLLLLALVATLILRGRSSPAFLMPVQALLPSTLTGLAFAVLHGLYALFRLERLSITSKNVQFSLLSPAATFLLVACGTFLFLRSASWRGRAVALVVANLGALAPATLLLLILGLADNLMIKPELGADLWNCHMGLQPLLAGALGVAVLAPVFHLLRRLQHFDSPSATRRPATGTG